MKLTSILPALACVLCAGCSTLPSLDPFVSEGEAVTDKAIEGTWQNAKGDDTYIVRRDGIGYTIAYLSGNTAPVRFRALLARMGTTELLDLTAADPSAFQIPAHYLVRVWPEDGTLRWAFLDSDWMKEQAGRLLPTRKLDDSTLIAASPEAVRALMWKHAADDRAAGDIQTLLRVP
jgi:hypothetical protein